MSRANTVAAAEMAQLYPGYMANLTTMVWDGAISTLPPLAEHYDWAEAVARTSSNPVVIKSLAHLACFSERAAEASTDNEFMPVRELKPVEVPSFAKLFKIDDSELGVLEPENKLANQGIPNSMYIPPRDRSPLPIDDDGRAFYDAVIERGDHLTEFGVPISYFRSIHEAIARLPEDYTENRVNTIDAIAFMHEGAKLGGGNVVLAMMLKSSNLVFSN